jgi:hypothetical protein
MMVVSVSHANVQSTRSDEPLFIRTTVIDQSVKFEQCAFQYRQDRLPIGNREFYSLENLRKARTHLRKCAIGVGVLDAAALTTAAYAGGLFLGAGAMVVGANIR